MSEYMTWKDRLWIAYDVLRGNYVRGNQHVYVIPRLSVIVEFDPVHS